MNQHRSHKALAFVTRTTRLLVFDHPEHPEAGTQVPKGTIEDGESPRRAALREAREESGLEGFEIVESLGSYTFDMSEFRPELQHRHVFWLRYTGEPYAAPDARWRSSEDDHGEPIPLEFYWVDLKKEGRPELIAGQGTRLEHVERQLNLD